MDWRDRVQTYFAAVHRLGREGQYERLLPFFQKQAVNSEWERLRREHRQLIGRGGSVRFVEGEVLPLAWMETEKAIEVKLSWTGKRRYGLAGQEWEEACRRLVRVRLQKGTSPWMIEDIHEWGGDAKFHRDEQEEPDGPGTFVDNTIAQPLLVVHGAGGYNPQSAVAYAESYWNSTNPVYPRFQDDCTNFISQCLHAGGIPMIFSKAKSKGWWIRTGKQSDWSYSWSVAHSLYLLLKSGGAPMRAVQKSTPEELVPGDIICYDFDGDGRFQHNTIVVAKDFANMPLVNAHTTDSRMRYWAYEDSTAYTPNIRYAFFHIRGM